MTKQEIIDYIMTTPSNPNKAVLEGMLDSFSGGESGGGSSRVLLYENEVNVTETYNDIIYGSVAGTDAERFNIGWLDPKTSGNWVVVVDDKELVSELIADGSYEYYIGIKNPGENPDANIIGCTFYATTPYSGSNIQLLNQMKMLMLDKNYFTTGTHSVKIYKEA